uniref:Solute carrier family 10 member 4 n=1 Tax=Fundulus heteroclitus TaxID=8078 RepID=A0A3Q2PGV2_FUNHE
MEKPSAQGAAVTDLISYSLRQTVGPRKESGIDGFSVTSRSMFLEGSALRTDAGFMAAPQTEPPHLVPAFWDSPLSHGINVFVGLVLCFTMLGLGCTVEVNQLGEHIRRPIGVLLALVCQFVIMPLVAFLLALAFSLDDVAAMAVLLCGCCPGGNLSNIMSLLVSQRALELIFCIIIMTISSTLTLIPIGLGVMLRYRHTRVADVVLKASLWSLLVTLVMLFILTGVMLGPELLSTIPPSVYAVAVLMPLCGYAAGYGLAVLFDLPPNSRRAVSMETGCQNVQLCTAILKLAFPPQLMGGMYMFPLLYALFQAAEAGLFILAYRLYRKEVLHKSDPLMDGDETDITYQRFHDEDFEPSYGAVTVSDPNAIMLEPCPPDPTPV